MGEKNKVEILKKFNIGWFMDDSCVHIKNIYEAKKIGGLSDLKELIWSRPEVEGVYKVDLDKPLLICENLNNWQNKVDTEPGELNLTVLQEPVIKILTYNVGTNNKDLKKKTPPGSNKQTIKKNIETNLKKYIDEKLYYCDIIGLQEYNTELNLNLNNKFQIFGENHTDLKLYVNKKFQLEPTIQTQTIKRIGDRPVVYRKFKKNDHTFIIINFHLPHIVTLGTQVTAGSVTMEQTNNSFIQILNELNYTDNDIIILMGDSNEYFSGLLIDKYKNMNIEKDIKTTKEYIEVIKEVNEKFTDNLELDLNGKKIIFKKSSPSCCMFKKENKNYQYQFISDIIGINRDNFEIKVDESLSITEVGKHTEYSDHLPVVAKLMIGGSPPGGFSPSGTNPTKKSKNSDNKKLKIKYYNFGIGENKITKIKFIGKYKSTDITTSVAGFAEQNKDALVLFSANGGNDGIFYDGRGGPGSGVNFVFIHL